MPYTLKQAAEATRKTKPTILRAIQNGKISAAKDVHGEWLIEPAELHRVYPPATVRIDANEAPRNDTQHQNLAYETGILHGEVEQLRERLAQIDMERERERREAADQIADLRRRLDQSEQERRDGHRQITALLSGPKEPEASAPPQRSFWRFLGFVK